MGNSIEGTPGPAASGAGTSVCHDEDITVTLDDERSQAGRKLLAEMDSRRTSDNRNVKENRVERMIEFIQENSFTTAKLRRCLKRFDELHSPRRDTLGYVDFCAVMHLDLLYARCEGLFASYSFMVDEPRTDEHGRRVNMKEFLTSLVVVVEAPVDDKLTIIYALWDEETTGYLDRKDLSAILQACHCVNEASDVAAIVKAIMAHARERPVKGITRRELHEAINTVPDLVFPRTAPPQPASPKGHRK